MRNPLFTGSGSDKSLVLLEGNSSDDILVGLPEDKGI